MPLTVAKCYQAYLEMVFPVNILGSGITKTKKYVVNIVKVF